VTLFKAQPRHSSQGTEKYHDIPQLYVFLDEIRTWYLPNESTDKQTCSGWSSLFYYVAKIVETIFRSQDLILF